MYAALPCPPWKGKAGRTTPLRTFTGVGLDGHQGTVESRHLGIQLELLGVKNFQSISDPRPVCESHTKSIETSVHCIPV